MADAWTTIWAVGYGEGSPLSIVHYRTEKLPFWLGLWNRLCGGDGTVTHFDMETYPLLSKEKPNG